MGAEGGADDLGVHGGRAHEKVRQHRKRVRATGQEPACGGGVVAGEGVVDVCAPQFAQASGGEPVVVQGVAQGVAGGLINREHRHYSTGRFGLRATGLC